jgi:hypothetical protein
MLRELASTVLLIGSLVATEARTNISHNTYERLLDNTVVSVLSNRDGFGVGANLSLARIGSIDAHYTVSMQSGSWAVSLSPFFGASYADSIRELPQTVQFSMGLQGLASYQSAVVSLQYWHMSCGSAIGLAWTDKQNIGLDLFALQAGWAF